MSTFRSPSLLLVVGLAALAPLGCSGGRVTTVPLLTVAGAPMTVTPSAEIPLEVTTKSTAIPDPLPVKGSKTYYADLEAALGHAVSSATVTWAEGHRDQAQATNGYALLVELTDAGAEFGDGRLRISLNVRATLRTRKGNIYLAQTHASCNQANLVDDPERGSQLVFRCMSQIGRELNGWLSGLDV